MSDWDSAHRDVEPTRDEPGEVAVEPTGGDAGHSMAHDDAVDEVGGDDIVEDDASADPRIAAALTRLEGLAGRPPDEHAEVYEEVHAVLAQALSDAQADRRQ